MKMAAITIIPPMVGVFFLSECIRLSSSESVFVVSSPTFNARSLLINQRPKTMLIKKAVKAARHERNDMYLIISSEFNDENKWYSKTRFPLLQTPNHHITVKHLELNECTP